MDSAIWTDIGELSNSEFDGDVSTTVETLCREALKARGDSIET